MKQVLRLSLLALVSINVCPSNSVVGTRNDISPHAQENFKTGDDDLKAKHWTDIRTEEHAINASDSPSKMKTNTPSKLEPSDEESTPSDVGTRGLFSGYTGNSWFNTRRPPWFFGKFDMFPSSPFYNDLDALYGNQYYGNSFFGDEGGFRRPNSNRYEQYPGGRRRYGMGRYDDIYRTYPDEVESRYPMYDQQIPAQSYYTNRPAESNAPPQSYYGGRPVQPNRLSGQFTNQPTPYDRNQAAESNAQLQRFPTTSTSYNQDQRIESNTPPQQFVTASTPLYQAQRKETNVPPQQFITSSTPYDQDQPRRESYLQNPQAQPATATLAAQNPNIRPQTVDQSATSNYGALRITPSTPYDQDQPRRESYLQNPQAQSASATLAAQNPNFRPQTVDQSATSNYGALRRDPEVKSGSITAPASSYYRNENLESNGRLQSVSSPVVLSDRNRGAEFSRQPQSGVTSSLSNDRIQRTDMNSQTQALVNNREESVVQPQANTQ